MKKFFISIAALAFIQAASAAPIDDRPDNWNSGDKRAHGEEYQKMVEEAARQFLLSTEKSIRV